MQPQPGTTVTQVSQGQVQPNPGYQTSMVNPTPIVVQQQPVEVKSATQNLGCPVCHRYQKPIVHYHTGAGTWLMALALFFLFFPLFWVPFVWKKCKDKDYIYPSCGTVISKKKIC